jgi:hypothetical protein
MAQKPILEALAHELGYKDAKALKKKMTEGHGDEFSGSVKSRLEEGAGFGEAFKGGFSDVKRGLEKKLDPKNIKKEFVKSAFGGDDIFSAYMRGKFRDKSKDKKEGEKEGATLDNSSEAGSFTELNSFEAGSFTELNSFLKIIAKSSMSLHMMGRDVNILRQNIIKLATIESAKFNKGKKAKDKVHAEVEADKGFFLNEDEREAKLEVERNKDKKTPTPAGAKPEEPKEEGGILDTILGFFKGGFLSSIMSIFNPANLLKMLGRVFIIATIFASLFKGITAAFDKWKETGSIKDAIIAGLGAIVDFLTFGLFGEDSVKKMFDAVEGFIDPIIKSISETFTAIKDWVANNIGIPKIAFKIPVINKEVSLGPWYPFKDNPTSEEPQQTSTPVVADVKSSSTTPVGAPVPSTVSTPSSSGSMSAYSADAKNLQEKYGSESSNDNSPSFELPKDAKEAEKLIVEQASRVLNMPLPDPQKMAKDGTTGSPELDKTIKEQIENVIKEKKIEPQSSAPSVGGSSSSGSVESDEKSASSANATPSPMNEDPKTTGSELDKASADIAEQQRMESAADAGNQTTNSSVTNNSNSSGKEPTPQIVDVYDTEFAKLLAA